MDKKEAVSEMSKRITVYVMNRLKRETIARGGHTKIVRETGLKGSTISNIASGEQTVGIESLLALMTYWHIDMGQLQTEVLEATAGETFTTHAEVGRAMARLGGIPDDSITHVLDREGEKAWNEHDPLWWFDQMYADYKKEMRRLKEETPLGKGRRRKRKAAPAEKAAPASKRATGT